MVIARLKSRFLRAFGSLMVGNFVTLIIGLVTMPLVVRQLGVSQYGIYTFGFLCVQMVSQFTSVNAAYSIAVQGKRIIDGNIAFALLVDLVLKVFAFVTLFLCAGVAESVFQISKLASVIRIYSLIILMGTGVSLLGLLRLRGAYRLIVSIDVCAALLKLVLVVYGVIQSCGLYYFVWVYVVGEVGRSIGYLVVGMIKYRGMLCDSFHMLLGDWKLKWRERLAFMYSSYWTTNLKWVARESDLLVASAWGPDVLGALAVVKRLCNMSFRFMQPLNQIWLPELALLGDDRRRCKYLLWRSVLIIGCIALLMAAGLFIWGQSLLGEVFYVESTEAFVTMLIYFLSFGLVSSFSGFGPAMRVYGNERTYFYGQFFSFLLYGILVICVMDTYSLPLLACAFGIKSLFWVGYAVFFFKYNEKNSLCLQQASAVSAG